MNRSKPDQEVLVSFRALLSNRVIGKLLAQRVTGDGSSLVNLEPVGASFRFIVSLYDSYRVLSVFLPASLLTCRYEEDSSI
jgi:hypothetical protein